MGMRMPFYYIVNCRLQLRYKRIRPIPIFDGITADGQYYLDSEMRLYFSEHKVLPTH